MTDHPHPNPPGAADLPLLRARVLDRTGIAHGFTTRAGGVSVGDLATLNLGPRAQETAAALAQNWARVARALDPRLGAGDVALMSQVHGAAVLRVEEGLGPHRSAGEADALFTTAPGVLLAVRVADCVPVLVGSPRAVGVAHAGWRGVVAGVVPALVRAMVEATGDAPGAMAAVIGPHIGVAAYEVGDEVVDGVIAAGLDPERCVRAGPRRAHVDLGAAVRQQLEALGMDEVEHLGLCTFSDPRFYSHRRDGAGTGRLAGVIARWELS